LTGKHPEGRSPPDTAEFIRANLRIVPAPSVPEISLYAAHPGSGLWRLLDNDDAVDPPPPYWAYNWAGGTVLARYILDRPESVAGRRVLDLGAGSGIVGIAAAKAGARKVIAAEIDPDGVVALRLNAAANDVVIAVIGEDLTVGPPPAVDLVLVGDLFYDAELAENVLAFLDRCLADGIEVLIGDPGRASLPIGRLRIVAEYQVPDFGDGKAGASKPSAVFALEPAIA
jgi:predicted nicotinamide N-methyase